MCCDERIAAVNGHTALVELLSVVQHILADLTQIDVEVATVVGSILLLRTVYEGVEEPELNIFDVGLLEIVGIQLTHHAAPVRQWQIQRTVHIDVGIEVIRTTFLRIISYIEDRQCRCGTAVGRLVAVGV